MRAELVRMERPAPDSQLAHYAVNREDPRRRACVWRITITLRSATGIGLDSDVSIGTRLG